MLKKYQPSRPDLLINTDWGIPKASMTKEEGKAGKMVLFRDRWVTREEKKRLKDELLAYRQIRMTGIVLVALALLVAVNLGPIIKSGFFTVILATVYAAVMAASGIGLVRYNRFSRYLACIVFLSFFVLPFMPGFEDDKGSPLLFLLGAAGLYYIMRKTTRKILAGPSPALSDAAERKRPFIRIAIYAVLLILALLMLYTMYDLIQARQMSADACNRAKEGMSLGDFLTSLSPEEYKIIKRPREVMIVPKRGMGRNHCVVYHDGEKITGSKAGFTD